MSQLEAAVDELEQQLEQEEVELEKLRRSRDKIRMALAAPSADQILIRRLLRLEEKLAEKTGIPLSGGGWWWSEPEERTGPAIALLRFLTSMVFALPSLWP